MGSPLEFLARRDPEIQSIVEKCLGAVEVRSWMDFFDERDALCSKVPLENGGKFQFEQIELAPYTKLPYTKIKSALGMAHNAYFEHPAVLAKILG